MVRELNPRYMGKSVTAQAVRNWINGEAMPTADKIRTLAKWLKATPHWLNYGEGEKISSVQKMEEERNTYGVDVYTTLPEDFQRLAPKHKAMVCEIVRALLRTEQA